MDSERIWIPERVLALTTAFKTLIPYEIFSTDEYDHIQSLLKIVERFPTANSEDMDTVRSIVSQSIPIVTPNFDIGLLYSIMVRYRDDLLPESCFPDCLRDIFHNDGTDIVINDFLSSVAVLTLHAFNYLYSLTSDEEIKQEMIITFFLLYKTLLPQDFDLKFISVKESSIPRYFLLCHRLHTALEARETRYRNES